MGIFRRGRKKERAEKEAQMLEEEVSWVEPIMEESEGEPEEDLLAPEDERYQGSLTARVNVRLTQAQLDDLSELADALETTVPGIMRHAASQFQRDRVGIPYIKTPVPTVRFSIGDR